MSGQIMTTFDKRDHLQVSPVPQTTGYVTKGALSPPHPPLLPYLGCHHRPRWAGLGVMNSDPCGGSWLSSTQWG